MIRMEIKGSHFPGEMMMTQKAIVVFDGKVLHPDAPLNLIPHNRYLITIQEAPDSLEDSDAWDVLEALTGIVEAPSDWSAEHDHYLYGTPKQLTQNSS